MTLVPIVDVAAYVGGSDTDPILISMHLAAEGWISSECGVVLAEADHREFHFGIVGDIIRPYNSPVNTVYRVCSGSRSGLLVRMDSGASKSSNAIARVTASAVKLYIVGGTHSHPTESISLDNNTLADVVSLINDIGKGWSARLASDSYGGFPATDLLPTLGVSALDRDAKLLIPTAPLSGSAYYLMGDRMIRFDRPPGGSCFIEYNAGYNSSNCPADLRDAVLQVAAAIYTQHSEGSTGLRSYSIGDISKAFRDGIGSDRIINSVINRYSEKFA